MMRRPSLDTFFLAAALAALTVPGCGNRSASGAASADQDNAVRSTEIVHEPCDLESKDAEKVDVNGDSKPDLVTVRAAGREACRAVDLNFDGRWDSFVYLDPAGNERRRESDFDRDGVIDEIATMAGGVVVGKERETNLDGKLDTWDTYTGGKLTKRIRDTTGDGRIDEWWEFPNPDRPDCPVIAIDRDADGRPDSRQDVCKENEAEKGPPAASSAAVPAPPPAASSAPATPAPPDDAGAPDAKEGKP